MNKIKNFVFTFVALLAVQFVALAQQEPVLGDPGAGGVPADNLDTPEPPIDTYIWVLLVIGLVYVFYKYKNHIKLNTCSNN
jgi:hypothetical protein